VAVIGFEVRMSDNLLLFLLFHASVVESNKPILLLLRRR
jgi:hypothetical protein